MTISLDDDSDMLVEQLPFFVQTSTDTGLLPHHVDKIVEILGGMDFTLVHKVMYNDEKLDIVT